MRQVIIAGTSLIFILLAMQVSIAINSLNNGSIQLVVSQLQGVK